MVASHPLHILFHVHHKFLGATTSHTGFSNLIVQERSRFGPGDYFHQLLYRYFECNYGGADVPCDLCSGSFHDGTPEVTARRKAHVGRVSSGRADRRHPASRDPDPRDGAGQGERAGRHDALPSTLASAERAKR